MSMILIYHFLYHGATPTPTDHVLYGLPIPHNAMLFCGVNLFILISGYYGMKFTWKSVIKLALLVWFFVLLNIILIYAFGGALPPTKLLNKLLSSFLLPLSHHYWFISIYFILMATVPILNPGLKRMTIRQLRIMVVILTFITIYSCGLGGNSASNGGYDYPLFLYLYVCGYYIHREPVFKTTKNYVFLIAFFAIGILDYALAYLEYRHLGKIFLEGNYNHPFVLFAAFALFIYFSNISIHSKVINRIAACALGCYMLQDGIFGNVILYPILRESLSVDPPFMTAVMIIFAFILIWIGSFIFTNIANLWIPKTTEWLCNKFRHINSWMSELSED